MITEFPQNLRGCVLKRTGPSFFLPKFRLKESSRDEFVKLTFSSKNI